MGNDVERLLTIHELSEMLGIPVDTLYGWRHRGEGPQGYRIGRHVRYRRAAVEAWLEGRLDQARGRRLMASIERRRGRRRDASGRVREVVHYRVRYRDSRGKNHSETFPRLADAERSRVEIAHELTTGTWHDRHRGDEVLRTWVADWLPTRHDLRATTRVRLEVTMNRQVLPRFGDTPLNEITNSDVRRWVVELMDSGLSAATTRKAVFALRQALEAAIADQRLVQNAAAAVPLPPERSKPARFLSQTEVERLVAEVPPRDRALILVGAYAGLRWGEAAGLRRQDIDPMRSRVRVTGTAVELRGHVTLDNEPKTTRSKRTIPVPRGVMRRLEQHVDVYVEASSDSLVFTAPAGGPLFRSWGQKVLEPAVQRAGVPGITFHGLRHSFVAIMVAAGCNVREVSEWAGHNSVAFTLTRYGGLFEDGTDDAIDRLDALLGPMP